MSSTAPTTRPGARRTESENRAARVARLLAVLTLAEQLGGGNPRQTLEAVRKYGTEDWRRVEQIAKQCLDVTVPGPLTQVAVLEALELRAAQSRPGLLRGVS